MLHARKIGSFHTNTLIFIGVWAVTVSWWNHSVL